MAYTTKKEKDQLAQNVHKYIQAGNSLSILRYTRLMSWLGGMTFAEIAEEQGLTAQAVANSVRRDAKLIKKFATEND